MTRDSNSAAAQASRTLTRSSSLSEAEELATRSDVGAVYSAFG